MTTHKPNHETLSLKPKRMFTEQNFEFQQPLRAILEAVERIHHNPQLSSNKHLDLIRQNSLILLARAERLYALSKQEDSQDTAPLPAFIKAHMTTQSKLAASSDAYQLLQGLHQIILANLKDQGLSPGFLCHKMGMSRTQLYRKVKKVCSLTVSKYIRLVRLHVAREMLETKPLSIGEVAYQVGFKDQSYFSRLFLAEFGVRPKELR